MFIESFLIGGAGGFINCLLFQEGFVVPNLIEENNKKRLQIGFFSNVFLGAAAGFLMYAFIARDLELIKQTALIFLGGIGGGNVLISFLQQNVIKMLNDKSQALANITEVVTKAK